MRKTALCLAALAMAFSSIGSTTSFANTPAPLEPPEPPMVQQAIAPAVIVVGAVVVVAGIIYAVFHKRKPQTVAAVAPSQTNVNGPYDFIFIAADRETKRWALCDGAEANRCEIGDPQKGFEPQVVQIPYAVATQLGLAEGAPTNQAQAPLRAYSVATN